MRILFWPICALFGHEAEGFLHPVNTHDAMQCACGRRLISNFRRWQSWADRR